MKNMVLITVIETWYDFNDQFAWTILGREVRNPEEGHDLFEKASEFLNLRESFWSHNKRYKQIQLPNGMSHTIELTIEEVRCF